MDVAGSILRFLGDLSPAGAPRLDVTANGLAWLGTEHWPTGPATATPAAEALGLAEVAQPLRVDGLHALAQLDAVHGALPILRLGWVYLVGPVTHDGSTQQVVLPLVERMVRLVPSLGVRRREPPYRIEPVGPWDISSLVGDTVAAAALEGDIPLGGGALNTGHLITSDLLRRLPALTRWTTEVAAAMGAPQVQVRPPEDPRALGDLSRPVAVVGFGVHVALDVDRIDLRSCLHGWAGQHPQVTAFHHAYSVAPAPDAPRPVPELDLVESSVVLSAAQEEVVRRSRTEPITVVTGPPGTGKSHTAVAVALDAVARGERVLMATRSAEAADVLAALLERGQGPDPVLFGGGVRASRLARTLAEGLAHPSDPAAGEHHDAAARRARAAADAVDRILVGLGRWERYRSLEAEIPIHRVAAPRWFDPQADLDAAARLVDVARDRTARGSWRADRAVARARRHAGAGRGVGLVPLAEALEVASVRQAAGRTVPTVPEARWAELETADAERRTALGREIAAAVHRRVESRHTRAVAALAAALRAGRGQRRRHLRSVDAEWLTHALPLWVGTLGDIEELLPQVAGMFDLVVLDEASQIDQPAAAVALLRARRAVVVGDPHQLRAVSFVADRDVHRSIREAGLEPWADRLDVRRTSAFDLAAGAAPVTMLDEHFRGPPHLVGFSARRFYGGRLTFPTRHPATEEADRIEVRTVSGERHPDGHNPEEVRVVLDLLTQHLEGAQGSPDGAPSIGVVTPFRAQAEAVWAGVREVWSVDAITAVRLRVGTVHSFQGDERDVVVVSTGVGPDHAGLRFLEDPHLFNVMVTRARQRMVVVTSQDEPRPGLLRDFLRWASAPPPALGDGPQATDPWAAAIAAALSSGGVPARLGYQVGRERIDLVVGEGPSAVGVETSVHREGPAAHRRRHLALRRSGWRVVDAFAARFDADPIAAAVELATLVGRPLAEAPGAPTWR